MYTEKDIIPGLVYRCGEYKNRLAIIIGPKHNSTNTIGVFFLKDTGHRPRILFPAIDLIVIALNSGSIVEIK